MNCSGVCDVYCVCGASRCRNHIFDLTVKSWSLNPTTTLNTYLHSLFSGRFRVLKPAASDVLFPVLVFDGVFDLSPWTASQLWYQWHHVEIFSVWIINQWTCRLLCGDAQLNQLLGRNPSKQREQLLDWWESQWTRMHCSQKHVDFWERSHFSFGGNKLSFFPAAAVLSLVLLLAPHPENINPFNVSLGCRERHSGKLREKGSTKKKKKSVEAALFWFLIFGQMGATEEP